METAEFKALAESGNLTIGQAIDHAMTMPKAGSRIEDLKTAISAGKLGETTLDTPLAEAFKSESFLTNVDTPRANYYVGVQGFENALKTAFVRAKLPYLSTLGLETELAGAKGLLQTGGYSEGQLRRTRQMQGLIPSADLDKAYADAFTNMGDNVSNDTKRFLFFHKNTVARVETILGAPATKKTPAKPPMTLADVIISSDPDSGEPTVTLKGETRVNKTRLAVTYKGTMAAFLKEQFDTAKARGGDKALKDIKLFDTTKAKTDAAHNKYIKPIVEERFPTQIPIDPKTNESGWRPTDIRSAVQDQLEKEFRIDRVLAEDYAGHKVKDAYKSAGANPETIGEISENLVRQSAKNLGISTTNSLITTSFNIQSPALSTQNAPAFPALTDNYRGAGQILQPSKPLTELDIKEIESAQRVNIARLEEQALDLQKANIETGAALDVDAARTAAERQSQLADIKAQVKDEKAADAGNELRKRIRNRFTTLGLATAGVLGATPGPLGDLVGLGVESALADKTDGPDRFDVAEEKGRQGFAELFGIEREPGEKSLATSPGALLGTAGELFGVGLPPKVPTDITRMRARQPETPPAPAPPVPPLQPDTTDMPRVRITESEPFQRRQGMLSAEGAKDRVNQARSAALAGEETTLRGSFLN